jgi:hypothetical protein
MKISVSTALSQAPTSEVIRFGGGTNFRITLDRAIAFQK